MATEFTRTYPAGSRVYDDVGQLKGALGPSGLWMSNITEQDIIVPYLTMEDEDPFDRQSTIALEAIDKIINGGIMPDGWKLEGTVSVVHAYVCNHNKQVLALQDRVERLQIVVEELIALRSKQ